MPEQEDGPGGVLSAEGFEALYQGRGAQLSEGGPQIGVTPWKLDEAQPVLVEWEEAGEITGPVLECGCGHGENALYMAGRGHSITAFDVSPTAIEQDRAKATEAGLSVTFAVADATTLEDIPSGFATVVDSALLHCLNEEQRHAYLSALRTVCRPGARLHVLCFQGPAEGPRDLPLPTGLDESSLRNLFEGNSWHVERMEHRHIKAGLTRDEFENLMPAEMLEQFLPARNQQSADEQGRVLLPAWKITAQLA